MGRVLYFHLTPVYSQSKKKYCLTQESVRKTEEKNIAKVQVKTHAEVDAGTLILLRNPV